MSELVRRTGVRPATIRHYLRLGLIPRPYRAAQNRFLYDRRHVQALSLVKLLRERRQMPLAEIAQILPSLAKMPDEQAFRPDMWDKVLLARPSHQPATSPAERLLAAGLSAFTRHGLSEVTVDDICRLAELAKGSFYLHYHSKEELFFAAVMAAGAEVTEEFGSAACAGPPHADPPGLSEEEAAALLGGILAERLPLLLELLALAAQRRPGHARAAQEVFHALRGGIRPHLRPPVGEQAERRVVGDALVQGIRQVIGVIDRNPLPGA